MVVLAGEIVSYERGTSLLEGFRVSGLGYRVPEPPVNARLLLRCQARSEQVQGVRCHLPHAVKGLAFVVGGLFGV